jgi:hypothetical protein
VAHCLRKDKEFGKLLVPFLLRSTRALGWPSDVESDGCKNAVKREKKEFNTHHERVSCGKQAKLDKADCKLWYVCFFGHGQFVSKQDIRFSFFPKITT